MRRHLISAKLAAAVLLPAAGRSQDAPAEDRSAIEALWQSYSAAPLDANADA